MYNWLARQRKFFCEAAVLRLDPDALLRQRLGAALLHWWEPRRELVNEDGNLSAMAALAGGADFVNSTSGVQYIASGGPGGRPYISLLNSTAFIQAPASYSTGRVALYSVLKFSGTAAVQNVFSMHATMGLPTGNVRLAVSQTVTGQYNASVRFTSGVVGVASGTADASWHAWSIRPLATGASWRKDGVEMSPTLASTDTVSGGACAQIGHGEGGAGGSWACSMLVDLATDPIVRDQAVADYVWQRFKLKI